MMSVATNMLTQPTPEMKIVQAKNWQDNWSPEEIKKLQDSGRVAMAKLSQPIQPPMQQQQPSQQPQGSVDIDNLVASISQLVQERNRADAMVNRLIEAIKPQTALGNFSQFKDSTINSVVNKVESIIDVKSKMNKEISRLASILNPKLQKSMVGGNMEQDFRRGPKHDLFKLLIQAFRGDETLKTNNNIMDFLKIMKSMPPVIVQPIANNTVTVPQPILKEPREEKREWEEKKREMEKELEKKKKELEAKEEEIEKQKIKEEKNK